MNDLITKLTSDMRWRLTRAGKEHKPTRKERESWGVFRFPPLASVLIWIAVMPLIITVSDGMHGDFEPLVGILGVTLLTTILTAGVHQFNKSMIMRTYRRLLSTNERFTLVEYARYLKRQIKRARQDPTLGGAAEVQRLQTVYSKLNRMLHQGAGSELFPVESQISKEADLAEAVIETYNLTEHDELAELDSKLPSDIRQRLEQLELEVEPLTVPKRELE